MNSHLSPLTSQLRRYFYSGWAFLVPYLAFYLLYYWQKWPVNPMASRMLPVTGDRHLATNLWPQIPSLLYVYWALHVIHALVGVIAFCSWWQASNGRRLLLGAATRDRPFKPQFLILKTALRTAAPWIFLALIFAIPGIYLEWPSDAWEHLRRINEWRVHDIVSAHSTWKKSSYFLPYSLTAHVTGMTQLSCLKYYYSAVSLLLCWQYYRLGRTVGLGERASFVFVLLNALSFGNNIFSFYRYYGLSSSIYAQLGAVALTKIAVGSILPNYGEPNRRGAEPGNRGFRWQSYASAVSASLLLCALVAFNHAQGLGLAFSGVAAVLVCWTFKQSRSRRTMAISLLLATVLLSYIAIVWLPRHPALDQVYRPKDWITYWYGLVGFSTDTASFQRWYAILGTVGVLNLAAGLVLIVRGHVVGTLTLAPLLLMSWPPLTIPLLNYIAQRGQLEDLMAVQRLQFAAPSCLALVVLAELEMAISPARLTRAIYVCLSRVFARALILSLSVLVITTPGSPSYTRFFNLISVPPADLQGYDLVRSLRPSKEVPMQAYDVFIAPLGFGLMADAIGVPAVDGKARKMPATTDARREVIYRIIGYGESHLHTQLYLPSPRGAVSPYSAAGYLSGHWLPQFLLYEHCSVTEFSVLAKRLGFVTAKYGESFQGDILQCGSFPAENPKP